MSFAMGPAGDDIKGPTAAEVGRYGGPRLAYSGPHPPQTDDDKRAMLHALRALFKELDDERSTRDR